MSITTVGDRLGPVELLVMEFPQGAISAPGFATMTDLVDRGIITVLDLEFVRRTQDGAVEPVEISDAVAGAPEDLGYLVGASTGLLDADDIATVGDAIEPGSLAGVLLFEHVWIMPMVDAVQANGSRVLLTARIAPEDVEAALDRADGQDAPGARTHGQEG